MCVHVYVCTCVFQCATVLGAETVLVRADGRLGQAYAAYSLRLSWPVGPTCVRLVRSASRNSTTAWQSTLSVKCRVVRIESVSTTTTTTTQLDPAVSSSPPVASQCDSIGWPPLEFPYISPSPSTLEKRTQLSRKNHRLSSFLWHLDYRGQWPVCVLCAATSSSIGLFA